MPLDRVIEAQRLTKHYQRQSTNALDQISFSIQEGESIGLLGPNGAGKTTLIKLLCGVIPPTSGAVRILGHDPYRDGSIVKRMIGVVHQRTTFDQFLTPDDNLVITAAYFGLKWSAVKPMVEQLIEIFQVGDCRSQPVFTLSGGQARRFQVIRALLKQPRILILDEPSAGLDVTGRRDVWRLLHELRIEKRVSILWSSHYVEELERNCDRVLMIKHGTLIRFDRVDRLVRQFGSQRIMLTFAQAPDEVIMSTLHNLSGLTIRKQGQCLELFDYGEKDALPSILATLQHCASLPTEIKIVPGSLEDAYRALIEGQFYADDRPVGLTPARVSAVD